MSNGSDSDGTVRQYERDGTAVVIAHGDFDADTLAPLLEALEAAADKYSRVVIDVSGVVFADSTFLNLLLRVCHQTSLRVAGPTAQLRRVLQITGTDTVLDIRESITDALT
ncbi:STAS domain-containing protein [Streptomyces sp. MBT49]|uniref:STAS domain-containing protein n=1 Tax=Streptomyces sp. MBT49 TaxID=1488380 RepID=UPI00190BE664|nr:STAS domain-containing protein [Streptomyces sp. MBT49]MBK3629684.1 STAS domain-containing protein [Streptomyces sp. MBT49]